MIRTKTVYIRFLRDQICSLSKEGTCDEDLGRRGYRLTSRRTRSFDIKNHSLWLKVGSCFGTSPPQCSERAARGHSLFPSVSRSNKKLEDTERTPLLLLLKQWVWGGGPDRKGGGISKILCTRSKKKKEIKGEKEHVTVWL